MNKVTAASSLALGITPGISHYLPFFQSLSLHDGLGSGIATTLAPAVAVAVFVTIAVSIITCKLSILLEAETPDVKRRDYSMDQISICLCRSIPHSEDHLYPSHFCRCNMDRRRWRSVVRPGSLR
jgi:hypothetical protein